MDHNEKDAANNGELSDAEIKGEAQNKLLKKNSQPVNKCKETGKCGPVKFQKYYDSWKQ